jgi:hypothetical protein
MSLQVIFGLLLALWGPAAVCNGASYLSQTVIPQNIPRDLMITLERDGGGFPYYPTYKLTITADGAVIFEGRGSIEGTTMNGSISRKRLRQLMAEFYRVKFFALEENYTESRLGRLSDGGSAVTSIRINGKSKMVRHNLGCRGPEVPKELTELDKQNRRDREYGPVAP